MGNQLIPWKPDNPLISHPLIFTSTLWSYLPLLPLCVSVWMVDSALHAGFKQCSTSHTVRSIKKGGRGPDREWFGNGLTYEIGAGILGAGRMAETGAHGKVFDLRVTRVPYQRIGTAARGGVLLLRRGARRAAALRLPRLRHCDAAPRIFTPLLGGSLCGCLQRARMQCSV